MLLGIDPRREPWVAWQVRRAVFTWGSWFDARRQETVERPIPQNQKPTMRVPKYSEGQLRAMLGLTSEDVGETGYRIEGGRIVTQADIERMALSVLRGNDDDDDEE